VIVTSLLLLIGCTALAVEQPYFYHPSGWIELDKSFSSTALGLPGRSADESEQLLIIEEFHKRISAAVILEKSKSKECQKSQAKQLDLDGGGTAYFYACSGFADKQKSPYYQFSRLVQGKEKNYKITFLWRVKELAATGYTEKLIESHWENTKDALSVVKPCDKKLDDCSDNLAALIHLSSKREPLRATAATQERW